MRVCNNSFDLASINLINRDGISETISNPERLKRYKNLDFFTNQPYQKVLRVYQRNGAGDVLAFVTSYHTNGQIKQYLELVNGRALGTYREWHADGKLKAEAYVISGDADITVASQKTWLFDGCSQAWDEQGQLIASIPYEKGVLQGISVYYHSNGNIWKQVPFEKNEINGTYKVFLEEGELLLTSEYCCGEKEGLSLRYWQSDKIASQEIFCEGKLTTGRYFDLNGTEISRIDNGLGFRAIFGKDCLAELHEYHDGTLEGEIKVYGRNNRLIKLFHVKNRVKHGEEIEYYDKGGKSSQPQPKLLISWYNAKIQGIVKTWYDNGVLESQREMSNNAKNGLSTAWYRDGNLMLMEEYDHQKLVRGEYFKKGDKIPVTLVSFGKGIVTLFDSEGHFIRKINYLNGVPVD